MAEVSEVRCARWKMRLLLFLGGVAASRASCWSSTRATNAETWLQMVKSSVTPWDVVAGIQELSASEKVTLNVEDVGAFNGTDAVLEYILLTRPAFNLGALEFLERTVVGHRCINNDTVAVDTTASVSMNGGEPQTIQETDVLTFGADLILENNATSGVFEDAIDNAGIGRKRLCDSALIPCPGPLYPYSSLQECYEVMSTIPLFCAAAHAPVRGDTVGCRFLHVGSAFLDGLTHCPHIGNASVKCRPDQCPENNPTRIADYPVVPSTFDATLPAGLAPFEYAVYGVAFLLAATMYLVWRVQPDDAWTNAWIRRNRQRDGTADEVSQIPMASAPPASCRFRGLEMWLGKPCDAGGYARALRCDELQLGGCKVTALMGESGCGKTTLLRLISGFDVGFMHLRIADQCGSPTVYCPQSADMWPREMAVRDVLLMAARMGGTHRRCTSRPLALSASFRSCAARLAPSPAGSSSASASRRA